MSALPAVSPPVLHKRIRPRISQARRIPADYFMPFARNPEAIAGCAHRLSLKNDKSDVTGTRDK
jgi:hypothetical protein